MNIYLVGYRCTGKTTAGRAVGAQMCWPFLDTDQLVMESAGSCIKEIVETSGWETFRRLEERILVQIAHKDQQVVATGGGIVLDASNVHLMKKSGTVIWLKAKPDTIASRMVMDPKTDEMRPALTDHGIVREITRELAIREPLYREASDFCLPTDHHSIVALPVIIMRLIREHANIRQINSETKNQPQSHIHSGF